MCSAYAEWKFLTGDYPGLEAIFTQYLKVLPSLKLWKIYLQYLRNSKLSASPTDEEVAQKNAILAKAYESAVLHVGLDVDSLVIWWEYLEFIKSQPV